jgi:hypothetical protein
MCGGQMWDIGGNRNTPTGLNNAVVFVFRNVPPRAGLVEFVAVASAGYTASRFTGGYSYFARWGMFSFWLRSLYPNL